MISLAHELFMSEHYPVTLKNRKTQGGLWLCLLTVGRIPSNRTLVKIHVKVHGNSCITAPDMLKILPSGV